jgi:hypothetical protein
MRTVLMGLKILIGCSLTMACSRCPELPDIAGVYELKYPKADSERQYGVERLVIFKNGTYEQWFSLTGSVTSVINKGTWITRKDRSCLASAVNENHLLLLDSPVIVDDGFGKPILPLKRHENATWELRIKKKRNGEIYFPVNDDLGTWFKHVGSNVVVTVTRKTNETNILRGVQLTQ